MANTKNTTMVSVDCGKCGGNGRYYFAGGRYEACFPCEGRGKLRMSAARHEKLIADAAKFTAHYAAHRADEAALEDLTMSVYDMAIAAIDATGIDGARAIFAKFRTNHAALEGLVGAMRDRQLVDASNAVVRHMQTRARNGESDGRREHLATAKIAA